MSSVAEWDNEYARLARVASQLRTQGLSSGADPQQLSQHLARLESQLNGLSLSAPELQRRRRLVQHLQQPPGTPINSGGAVDAFGSPPPQSQMAMAMRQQDDMIDELAVGVSRLRDQTQVTSFACVLSVPELLV